MAGQPDWREMFRQLFEQMATARDLAMEQRESYPDAVGSVLDHLDSSAEKWSGVNFSDAGAGEAEVLGKREEDVAARELELLEARQKLEDDLRDLERRHEEQDDVVYRAQTGADGNGDAAYRELGTVRQKLRSANDAVTEKAKLLLATEAELHTAKGSLAKSNAVERKLREDMNSIQKQSKRRLAKAESRIRELELKVDLSIEANERTQDLLSAEERKQKVLQHALSKELASRGTGGGGGADNSRRHNRTAQAPVSGRAATGHLDVVGTIQRNQSLLNELTSRRVENSRLRQDNAHLLLSAKDASADMHLLKSQVVTSVHDRAELLRRLQKEKEESQLWQKQLASTAEAMVRRHQMEKAVDESQKWESLTSLDRTAPTKRTMGYKRYQTRNIQVARWADYSGGRMTGGGKYGR